jgi:hypothetical protein
MSQIPPSLQFVTTCTPAKMFREFLVMLKTWEQELFPKLSMEVDCYKFLNLVTSQELKLKATQLLTISDSSDNSGSMTFGWIISLPSS